MTDEEKKPYYDIMVETWRSFIKVRKAELFSDEWWQEIIDEYEAQGKKWKGTPYEDYYGDLTMSFLNQYERLKKQIKPDMKYQQEEFVFTNSGCKVVGKIKE